MPQNAKGAKVEQSCVSKHHIPMSKGDKKNVGDVVGLIIKKIAFIHFKPPHPTLTLAKHVPIVKFMGMMQSLFCFTFKTMARSITKSKC
jgi:hypothetical protein